jgi:hypothetical protein
MKRQGLKHLLGKELQRSMPGRVVDMQIGLVFEPPPGSGPEIFEILKVSSIEQIAFHILERRLDFPLRFRPSLSARNGLALIMGDEGGKCGVEDRPAALPSEHHRLFVIVKTLSRHSPKVLEGILMSSDQAIEVTVDRKVDVLPSGEAQDVRKTLYLALAGTGEGDRIRTPIHLTLSPRFRLKSYHRFSRRSPQFLEPLPQNADAPRITHFLQLLIDPQARDVGVLLQQLLDLWVESVKLAHPLPSRSERDQQIMAAVAPLGMGPQNPPDGITP